MLHARTVSNTCRLGHCQTVESSEPRGHRAETASRPVRIEQDPLREILHDGPVTGFCPLVDTRGLNAEVAMHYADLANLVAATT